MNRLAAWWLASRVPRYWLGPHWRRLLAAAEGGDRAAVAAIARLAGRLPAPTESVAEALWALVLTRPDPHPRLWHNMRRTGGVRAWLAGADGPERLDTDEHRRIAVELAGREDGHPAADAARRRILESRDPAVLEALGGLAPQRPGLAAWCAANDVVPDDPATAAVLFLVTGQQRRYRAIDPGGHHLSAAFAAAGPERRERLLAAVAAADDIDLVTVAGAEPELWRMIWRLTPAEAVTAAGRLGGWRPRAGRDRRLFDILTAGLAAAGDPLPAPFQRRLPADVQDVALAPDGGRVAVLADGTLYDIDVTTGQQHRYRFEYSYNAHLYRVPHWQASARMLAHLGDAVIGIDKAGLCHYAGGRRRILLRGDVWANVLRTGDGFVADQGDGRLYFGTAAGVDRHTDAAAEELRRHRRRLEYAYGHWLAVSPGGAHLALSVPEALAVLDPSGAPVATFLPRPHADRRPDGDEERYEGFSGVAFVAPDAFVVLERTRAAEGTAVSLTRWRVAGRELVREAAAALDGGRNLDGVDDTTLLALESPDGATVVFRDGVTLEPVEPPGAAGLEPDHYPRGARGRFTITREHGYKNTDVTVGLAPVYRLLSTPMGAIAPAALDELERVLDTGPPGLPARPLLEALRECLRLRFADEVGLGVFVPGPTDIELGP
ncbi:hypothetical protein ABT369_50865 [Dactylosporangium sp. NPDC000244]|uniref:hypothetical protein n=1 Tax=Dactylosporangium sp. NPDC000244 TaxID=3154365 RepID=UPI00331665C9